MQIFIKVNDKTVTMETEPTEYVEILKEMAVEKCGYDVETVHELQLHYAGKKLLTGHSLCEYNIQNESTIDLSFPLLGGSKSESFFQSTFMNPWLFILTALLVIFTEFSKAESTTPSISSSLKSEMEIDIVQMLFSLTIVVCAVCCVRS